MKNIISIGVIIALTLALFTSCDSNVFDDPIIMEPDTTELDTDTTLVKDEILLTIDGNEANTFNGISVNCQHVDPSKDNFLNAIAYAENFTISEDGTEVTYDENLFVFFWETENELEVGTYHSLARIELQDGSTQETVAEIVIDEVSEYSLKGNFTGLYLDDSGEPINFSGSFNVSKYNECEIVGLDLSLVFEFDIEFSFGFTILDIESEDQEYFGSLYLNCSQLFEEVEGNKHIQLIAEVILTSGSDLDEILEPSYFTYHREVEDITLHKEYDGRFGPISDDESELFTMGEEKLLSVTQPITIIYTDIDDTYVTGEYYGQYNGSEIKGNFKSQIFECD